MPTTRIPTYQVCRTQATDLNFPRLNHPGVPESHPMNSRIVFQHQCVCVLWQQLNQLINTHAPNNDKHFLAPSYSLEALEGFACHSFSSKSPQKNRVKTTRVRSGLADFDHFWQISTIKFTTFWILFRVLVMMAPSILQDHNAFFWTPLQPLHISCLFGKSWQRQ